MISKATMAKIRKIVERNYAALVLKVAGGDRRLLDLIYYHNYLNEGPAGPKTIPEMEAQQKAANLKGGIHESAVEHLNETLTSLIDKSKAAAVASVEGVVRDYNLATRNRLLQGLANAPESVDALKRKLRDIVGTNERDWKKVAVTETANAIGLGSVDRVVADNRGGDLEDVYVYRLVTPDAATCKWCRKFYQDSDGTPAVYRMSTLLANGSNYGLKTSDWRPVSGATHPNERCSPLIQVKRGWKVLPGGKLDFIGFEGWEEYIKEKVRK